MVIAVCSDIGKIREINQDSYYFIDSSDLPLFVVADGMGGHKAGEIASLIVTETVKEMYDQFKEEILRDELTIKDFISKTLNEANLRIYNKSNSIDEYKGMGTTVTMAIIYENILYIGQIGDSRGYLLRDEKLLQITQDHSLVAELLRNGSISEKDALNHPQKNIITRALGTDENVEIDIYDKELLKDDIIFLCTDGLTNMVNNDSIKDLLLNGEDIQKNCEVLINMANDSGGVDNITAMIIKFD